MRVQVDIHRRWFRTCEKYACHVGGKCLEGTGTDEDGMLRTELRWVDGHVWGIVESGGCNKLQMSQDGTIMGEGWLGTGFHVFPTVQWELRGPAGLMRIEQELRCRWRLVKASRGELLGVAKRDLMAKRIVCVYRRSIAPAIVVMCLSSWSSPSETY